MVLFRSTMPIHARFFASSARRTAVHGTLRAHELLEMQASNGTRVVITEKHACDSDIVVDRDDHHGANRYGTVVHRAD